MHARFSLLLGVAALATSSLAADWPIYRGVNHDGISAETDWSPKSIDDPQVLWETEVGIGFASFAVADGRVYTTGNASNEDTVFCLDAASGKVIWQHSYPADLGDKYFEGGTAGTPTVDGDRVYQLSRWGDLICFEAASGKVVWQRQLQKEKGYKIPDWGFAGSVFPVGDHLVLNVGESGMVVNKSDGSEIWASGNGEAAGYSTPYPVDIEGNAAVILASETAYNAVDLATGKVIWSIEWKTRYGVNAADPIIEGDQMFISSGYNKGNALYQLQGANAPKLLWENDDMMNQFDTAILLGGYLYGIHDNESKQADLRCVEWATGTVMWTERSIGFGAVAAADGKLIVQTEKGELAVVEATGEGYTELARGQVLSGRCWTVPVLANGRLYVRNSEGTVLALKLN